MRQAPLADLTGDLGSEVLPQRLVDRTTHRIPPDRKPLRDRYPITPSETIRRTRAAAAPPRYGTIAYEDRHPTAAQAHRCDKSKERCDDHRHRPCRVRRSRPGTSAGVLRAAGDSRILPAAPRGRLA